MEQWGYQQDLAMIAIAGFWLTDCQSSDKRRPYIQYPSDRADLGLRPANERWCNFLKTKASKVSPNIATAPIEGCALEKKII